MADHDVSKMKVKKKQHQSKLLSQKYVFLFLIVYFQVADLKRELKNRGLNVTGNKNDLVERLQSALIGNFNNNKKKTSRKQKHFKIDYIFL